jgi:hypothetical protein
MTTPVNSSLKASLTSHFVNTIGYTDEYMQSTSHFVNTIGYTDEYMQEIAGGVGNEIAYCGKPQLSPEVCGKPQLSPEVCGKPQLSPEVCGVPPSKPQLSPEVKQQLRDILIAFDEMDGNDKAGTMLDFSKDDIDAFVETLIQLGEIDEDKKNPSKNKLEAIVRLLQKEELQEIENVSEGLGSTLSNVFSFDLNLSDIERKVAAFLKQKAA